MLAYSLVNNITLSINLHIQFLKNLSYIISIMTISLQLDLEEEELSCYK